MEESDWISGGGKGVQASSRILSTGHRANFPRWRSGRDLKPTNQLHHSIEAKYAWNCNSTHLHVVLIYCLVKHRINLFICAYISQVVYSFQTSLPTFLILRE
jgi:hypothetical protein